MKAKAKPSKPSKKASAPLALVVEYVDPKTLLRDLTNPRTITPAARDRLKRGVARFGLPVPLLARAEDRVVIGGHQRLDVAIELGLTTVPVIFRKGLTDSEARALNILLNNPKAQGDWDPTLLGVAFGELQASGFDITLTGFDTEEIAAYFRKVEPPSEFDEKDENLATEHTCPSCGYRWSGKS